MKIFLISPVRKCTERIKTEVAQIVSLLEGAGYTIHWPLRDTKQDGTEDEICTENKNALAESDIVAVYYTPNSDGIIFDLGMAYAMGKPIYEVGNWGVVDETYHKSFYNLLKVLNDKYWASIAKSAKK